MAAAVVETYTNDVLEFRLRPTCNTPSPFKGLPFCNGITNNPALPPYNNGVIAADNAHDEILPIDGINLKGGNDYENNMMTNSLHHTDNKTVSEIFNTFGSIQEMPDSSKHEDARNFNINMCHIVDVWIGGGSSFCPGYNNYIDCADRSYKNFINAVDFKNPLKDKDHPFLFQQNDIFKFTALMNYDLLLYAALIQGNAAYDILRVDKAGDTSLQKAINLNINVMNFFWKCLLDETQKAIENDYILLNLHWQDHYLAALQPLRLIKFIDIDHTKENIESMVWIIDKTPDKKYMWGITQGTSSSSILKILKNLICCIPRGEGASKKKDKISCSDGLDALIAAQGLDVNKAAALHAICKFIGDTSHITFGNLVQLAKNAMKSDAGGAKLANLNALRVQFVKTVLPVFIPIPITQPDVESIIIHFWISERPMTTRICTDKQLLTEFSVGIDATQIIKNLYTNKPFDEGKKKQYLLVNFDELKGSKEVVKDLNNMYTFLGQPIPPELQQFVDIKDNVNKDSSTAEKNAFNKSITDFTNAKKDELLALKMQYKLNKLIENINSYITVPANIKIDKVVDILGKGGKVGALTSDPAGDSRKAPKQINPDGWTTLNKAVKKKKQPEYDQYNFLTVIVSLLLEFLNLPPDLVDDDNKKGMINVIKTANDGLGLYWLIMNLGNLYSKHAGNMYSIVSTALATTSNQESDDFCLYASNLIENVVKLYNKILEILKIQPMVGGGGDVYKLMARGLGCGQTSELEDYNKNLKTYVLSLINRDIPIYRDYNDEENPAKNQKAISVIEQYLDDNQFLKNFVKTIIPSDRNFNIFFGPFHVSFESSTGMFNITENLFLIDNIIETVIEYETSTINSLHPPDSNDFTEYDNLYEKIFGKYPFKIENYSSIIAKYKERIYTKRYMHYLLMKQKYQYKLYNPEPPILELIPDLLLSEDRNAIIDKYATLIEEEVSEDEEEKIIKDYNNLYESVYDSFKTSFQNYTPEDLHEVNKDLLIQAHNIPEHGAAELEPIEEEGAVTHTVGKWKSLKNRATAAATAAPFGIRRSLSVQPSYNIEEIKASKKYSEDEKARRIKIEEEKLARLLSVRERRSAAELAALKNKAALMQDLNEAEYNKGIIKEETRGTRGDSSSLTHKKRPSEESPFQQIKGLGEGNVYGFSSRPIAVAVRKRNKETVYNTGTSWTSNVGGRRVRTRKYINKKKQGKTRRLNKRLKKRITKHKKRKIKKYTRKYY